MKINKLIKHLPLLLVFFALSCKQADNQSAINLNNFQSVKTPNQKLDYFLKIADSIRDKTNVPGVGIAIIYNNDVLYKGGLGFRDVQKKMKITENTLFSIGSNTKPFTGLLTSKLVSDGLLDWDTPIKTYIPEFKLKNKYVEENATIADALAHRTGLGRRDDLWKYKDYPREEILNVIKDIDLVGSFRNSYGYNNFMYALVGISHERVTEKPWETLIKERIFIPLNMNDSYTGYSDFVNVSNKATGYKGDGVTPDVVVNLTHVAPSGAISSTPSDIAKWVKMLVNNGMHENERYMTDNEYNYMLKPHSNISLRNGNEFWYYNIGFGGYSKDNKITLGANGAIDGQNSRCVLHLDEGFGIFIMTNQISSYKELITQYAENIFLKNDFSRDLDAENRLASNSDFETFRKLLLTDDINKAKDFYDSIPLKAFENQMNNLGYELINNKAFKKALLVLKLNADDNPKSSNAYDSLGEIYMLMGEKALAIKNYKKSLELDPENGNAEAMLTKLNQ